MQECNSPRNSRLQTHQDEEARGESREGFAPGTKQNSIGLIDLLMP
jgi:hypothetical protein